MVPGLDRCVRCDYALEGLPDNHRCPECGLSYDELSRVWRPTGTLGIMTIMWVIILGLVIPGALIDWLIPSTAPLYLVRFMQIAWLLVVAAAVFRLYRRHRTLGVVATLPEGLFIRLAASELIPWNRVASPKVVHDCVEVGTVEGRSKIALVGMFKNKLEMQSFIREVLAARERYWERREREAIEKQQAREAAEPTANSSWDRLFTD